MNFEHIDRSQKYLDDIIRIIREGIVRKLPQLNNREREGLKTQTLVEEFNRIGTLKKVSSTWIGVQKELEHSKHSKREDIYFYLGDDDSTRIFCLEAKRLPKARTKAEDEYVIAYSTTGSPAGAIQRYKEGIHGLEGVRTYGVIAYIENRSISEWLVQVNEKISKEYKNDTLLILIGDKNEFRSTHFYSKEKIEEKFDMYHFWIDLIE